jgi:hypothetical protein
MIDVVSFLPGKGAHLLKMSRNPSQNGEDTGPVSSYYSPPQLLPHPTKNSSKIKKRPGTSSVCPQRRRALTKAGDILLRREMTSQVDPWRKGIRATPKWTISMKAPRIMHLATIAM